MYVKVGRDENNFYLYRAPLNSGTTAAAWSDLAIDFSRFINLQKRITDGVSRRQTGVDRLHAASTRRSSSRRRFRSEQCRTGFAACDDGYMVYTSIRRSRLPISPRCRSSRSGFIRLGSGVGASSILPSDTLEMWVDDIRLDQQVNSSGIAGQIGVDVQRGGLHRFPFELQ